MVAAPPIDEVWAWLADVPDPEIPIVSVVDLGIVRDVRYEREASGEERLHVTITPTYSGCPATTMIRANIETALHEHNVTEYALDITLTPPWSSDWIGAAAREKLRSYGIAPPQERASTRGISIARETASAAIACPRCASVATSLVSAFGSTPCKALYRCNACLEPFDHFKCH